MSEKWDIEQVITVVEKSVGLIVTLIRKLRTPDKVLRKITDLTQATKDEEQAIRDRMREITKREDD